MRVLIVGANGQLAHDLLEVFGRAHDAIGSTRADLELADRDSVRTFLDARHPDVVINPAAYHHLQQCEDNPQTAYATNAVGVLHLARGCDALGALLVQVSTDYVFDGEKRQPYRETDPPRPLSVYGTSKLAGELHASSATRHMVVRVSGLYGAQPSAVKGPNFVEKMLRAARERPEIRVVDDEVLTPTWTREIAKNLLALVEAGGHGCYHMTAAGECSWYAFTREIFRLAGVETPLHATTSAGMPSPVRRPAYSVLDNARLREAGLDRMRPWQDALADFMTLQGWTAAGRANKGDKP